jgi:hypothetical protein
VKIRLLFSTTAIVALAMLLSQCSGGAPPAGNNGNGNAPPPPPPKNTANVNKPPDIDRVSGNWQLTAQMSDASGQLTMIGPYDLSLQDDPKARKMTGQIVVDGENVPVLGSRIGESLNFTWTKGEDKFVYFGRYQDGKLAGNWTKKTGDAETGTGTWEANPK